MSNINLELEIEKLNVLLKIIRFPESKKSKNITFGDDVKVIDIVLCNYGCDYGESDRYQVHVFGIKKEDREKFDKLRKDILE